MREELLTLLAAATPVFELRGSIPLGLGFGLSPLKVYLLSVIGNAAIVVPIFLFLRHGSEWLMARSATAQRFFSWLFDRTRRKYSGKLVGIGLVGLALFVAVPLPMTGAWTATIASFLFAIPLKQAFIAILVGILTAGLIVLWISMGVIHFL